MLGILLFGIILIILGILAVPAGIMKLIERGQDKKKEQERRKAPEYLTCSNCETENLKNAKHCKRCGSVLKCSDAVKSAEESIRTPSQTARGEESSFSPQTILPSLVPGIGQFYNGQFKKGIVFALLPFIIGLTNRIHSHELFTVLFFWSFWIYNLYDFFNANKKTNAGGMGSFKPSSWSELGLGRKALSVILGGFSFLIVLVFLQLTFNQI